MAGPFSIQELSIAVKGMSNHKARGPDDMPFEVFRCYAVQVAIQPILQHIYDTSPAAILGVHSERSIDGIMDGLPAIMRDAFLTPIFKKKGDASSPANYRPVVLLSHVLKLLDKILLNRIRAAVDHTLVYTQSAYRQGRSCIGNILTLQQLLWKSCKSHNLPLFITFIDFSKAFDSVDRTVLSNVMQYFGFPPGLQAYIIHSLASQRLFARSNGTVDPSPITPFAGVMQGDTLAPYLFILCVDMILRKLPSDAGALFNLQGLTLPGTRRTRADVVPNADQVHRLTNLAYADDISLLSNTFDGATRLLHSLERSAAEIGLHLNFGVGKTELLVVGDAHLPIPELRTQSGVLVPRTDSYKYLGWMCSAKGWIPDFAKRTKSAWFMLRSYQKVWKSAVSHTQKRKLFYALVIPVLTYAAFTYPNTATVRRTLHTTCNAMLRYALNIRIEWDDPVAHVHTEALYADYPTLPTIVLYQYLSSWGHWVRDVFVRHMDHPMVAVLALPLSSNHHRHGTRCNPSKTIEDATQMTIQDTLEFACDRDKWRAICRSAAEDCELDMYESWILKRRLHDPQQLEHNNVKDKVLATLKKWLASRPEHS